MWLIIVIIGGVLGFFLVLCIIIKIWDDQEDKKRLKMEEAYREWKIHTGLDPTYDEYGRLRSSVKKEKQRKIYQ